MGVKACDRADCDNVMCDTLIDQQYVCDGCLEEFRSQHGSEERPFEEWMDDFVAFMATKKRERMRGSGSLAEFIERANRGRP
jgi:hypothetical protein